MDSQEKMYHFPLEVNVNYAWEAVEIGTDRHISEIYNSKRLLIGLSE